MPAPDTDHAAINLELREQIELCRHGTLQPSDLEADIALLEEWLEPAPCPRRGVLLQEITLSPGWHY